MTRLVIATYNYEGGGLVRGRGFDMKPLQRQVAALEDEPPALILFCEAKDYGRNGSEGLLSAASALSEQLGVPYVGVLGFPNWGKLSPAVYWNPTVLQLDRWPARDEPDVYPDQRNVARFTIRETGAAFGAWVAHWNAWSGTKRLQQAGYVDGYGSEAMPFIGGGDLNCTASGPHLPQRNWATAGYRSTSHKAVRHGGVWVPDTAAIDHLIGTWDTDQNRRVGGCGYQALAEIAWQATGVPPEPTVIHKPDEGGPLLIDWLLVNEAMLPHILVDTYRVHPQPDGYPPSSDHHLVSAVVDL